MNGFLALLLAVQGQDEAALRTAFGKEMNSTDAGNRAAAVRKLAGSREEESIAALTGALKDPDKDVRKAAAETIGSCKDEGGVAAKPLSALLNEKKEDPVVRLAAAKALGKCLYKGEALEALITCICGITNFDRELHAFGADVVEVLNQYSGEDYGKGKQTPGLWEFWWEDFKEKYRKQDQERRHAYKDWKERKTRKQP